MKFQNIILSTIAAVAMIAACEDNALDEVTFEEEEQDVYASENAAENLFETLEAITNSGLDYSQNQGGHIAVNKELEGAQITLLPAEQGADIKIDFGDGVIGPNGKTRKGIVIITYSDFRWFPGSVVTTKLENFSVDDIRVEGVRTVTNISELNELSTPKFTSVIKNGKLTWPDGSFITYDAQKVHTWELDENLEAITLNVEGTARGTTRRESDFRSTITSALTFQGQCIAEGAYLASVGKKRIEVDGRENHILVDYGEGACDNTFSVTIGEVKADITLD